MFPEADVGALRLWGDQMPLLYSSIYFIIYYFISFYIYQKLTFVHSGSGVIKYNQTPLHKYKTTNKQIQLPEADVGALRLWGDQVPLLRALLHLLHLHRTNIIKINNNYNNNYDDYTPSFLHLHKKIS